MHLVLIIAVVASVGYTVLLYTADHLLYYIVVQASAQDGHSTWMHVVDGALMHTGSCTTSLRLRTSLVVLLKG
jgi:hypothetical protein